MEQVITQSPMEFGAYLEILGRRKAHFLLPFCLVLAIASTVAVVLPPVYRSEATIMIDQQDIPTDFVETTVTGYAQERVQVISKRLMTTERLLEIADKFDLYPEHRSSLSKGEFVGLIRDMIEIEFESAQTGVGTQRVALSFRVSFGYRDPDVARDVTAELADLYLEENRRGRTEQAADVLDFLGQEARRLERQLNDLDSQIANFKLENRSDLPELSNMNLRLLDQTAIQAERSLDQIRDLQQRAESIRTQISLIDSNLTGSSSGVVTPAQHLAKLRAEFLQKSSVYSADHPDLVRLRRQIGVLEQQVADPTGVSGLSSELDAMRAALNESLTRYSETHPDVKRLSSAIAALEAQIRNGGSAIAAGAAVNPQHVMLRLELRTIGEDIEAERRRYKELQAKLVEYERRLVSAPLVLRDQTALTRDYENALKKYREIKDKQIEAQLAQQLELDEKGERFSLLGRATKPDGAESPNRLGIVLLGSVLAMGSGLGTVAVAEYSDRAIRGHRALFFIIQTSPLAAIPEIRTTADLRRRRIRNLIVGGSLLGIIIALILIVHVFLLPLDELWPIMLELQSEHAPWLLEAK